MIPCFLKDMANGFLQTLFRMSAETIKEDYVPHTVLAIAPHPDDEVLGCGAALARYKAMGARVRVVVVTDGAACLSEDVMVRAQLIKLRRSEMQQAARALGIPETDLVFLSHPDGQAQAHIEKITQDLAAQIWLCAPDLLFAPYGFDGHPDHRAIAAAIDDLRRTGKIYARVLFYPIWFWPRQALKHFYRPSLFRTHRLLPCGAYLEKKAEAMVAYRSQCEILCEAQRKPILSASFLAQHFRKDELFFEPEKPSPA